MSIVIVGLSHKTTPLTIRERAAFLKEELPRALRQLTLVQGVNEALILSTCNRVELVVEAADEQEAVTALKTFLHEHHGLKAGELDPYAYAFTSTGAIRHLSRVACGLDSLVIGEPQILGQIKDAYNAASEANSLGRVLNQLLPHTLRVAKRVRAETGISMVGWSVSRAAVELAEHVFGGLMEQAILVIGAGKMSELTTSHLRRSGALKVLVANRSYQRAALIAARFQGEPVSLEHLFEAMVRSDIVISSICNPSGYVVHRVDVERVLNERGGRPMLFIDIAVPRNIDPSVANVKGAFLSDIDGLEGMVASHGREMVDTVRSAEQLVEAEVAAFCVRQKQREVGPTIAGIKDRIQSIGCAELERQIGKLTTASQQDRQKLEVMVKRIANKILHPLIVQLKRHARSSSPELDFVETLTLAFGPDREGMLDQASDACHSCPGTAKTFGTGGATATT